MIKVLIADDEPLARKNIKQLLANQSDIGTIFEAGDGAQALQIALDEEPELIFLDILMPKLTGIQLMQQLPSNSIVIFATAYDQYAITAFELNAIDYLLKPFDDQRFYQSLQRARDKLGDQGPDYKQVGQLLQHMLTEKERKYKSRLVIKDPGRIRLLDVQQINYIAGAGNYAEVHLFDDKPLLHRETLTTLEKQLDPEVFIRIHRSTIVRRESIVELRPNEKGDYSVILRSGEHLTLSRRNKQKLDELLQ